MHAAMLMVRAGGNHSGRGWMDGWMYYCSAEHAIFMRVQLLLVDAMQINGEECSITVVQRVPLQVKRFCGVRRCDDAHL